MLIETQQYKVLLTWETIYDILDIAEYIECKFGRNRADIFQTEIEKEISKLEYTAKVFGETTIKYRGYTIQKEPFPPSIIFYVVMDEEKEIHVLRVLRQERNWEVILTSKQEYTYPN